MIRVQTFGWRELIDDLDRAEREIDRRVARVTKRSIEKIKQDAQRQIRIANYRTLPYLARSFTAGLMAHTGDQVIGEAGASHELPQGKLDVFIEHGSPTSNPHPHWRPALEREFPHWVDELENACAEDVDR